MADVGRISNGYSRFAKATAHFCGRPRVFVLAVAVIAVWIVTGPLFGFSDTWQLVINWHDDRHLPDGVPDPEHAEPRH